MKKKQKSLTKKDRPASLAVTPGSAFVEALTRAIEFHRTNPDDPHGIRSAVMVALTEVRDAMRYELNN
jgi:hypothetical protein